MASDLDVLRKINLATFARIELAENLAALASDLAESVMFMSERDRSLQHLTDADQDELKRILVVAAKLKHQSITLRRDML